METTKDKILRLLDTLPEPYNKQAVANYDPSFYEDGAPINNNNDALGCAFDWEKSPQGADYWVSLRRHLEDGDPLPEIKETTLKIGNTLNLVGAHSDGRDWLTRIYANGKTVLIALGSTEKESAEQAAFIVKACNSYEDMLEALKLNACFPTTTTKAQEHAENLAASLGWKRDMPVENFALLLTREIIQKATPPVS